MFAPTHPAVEKNPPHVFRFPSVPALVYPHMRLAVSLNSAALRVIRGLDVIHTHDPFSIGLLGFAVARFYGIPHVHTYHTLYVEYRKYLPIPIRPSRRMVERLSRILCNRCDAVIAPSTSIQNELLRYGVSTPIFMLPYGVDEEEFLQPMTWNAREELCIPDHMILLHVGRIGVEKNIDFLLRMFCHVRIQCNNVKLVLAGDGPYRSNLQQKAWELGISEDVVFTGFLPRKKLIDLYRQADLFVIASKTETQGLVVVEAMMAGLPVVAIKAMGVQDLVKDGETGFLVAEAEEEFAAACIKLLRSPRQMEKMSQAASIWSRNYTAQAATARLLKIYEGLLCSRN